MEQPHQLSSPAERIAKAYGGDAFVAVALSRQGIRVAADAVRKWRASREKGGGGGLVPAKYHGALLKDAVEQRIALTVHDLIIEHVT
ncbi:MAG: hypothetical protein KGL39_43375 [Patescibacteria group bacterium]|nr:hypothetical protein [Patescibacteria group bacterium]